MTTSTAILGTFYRAAGQFVSLAELQRALRQPAASVTAEIAELEGLGYRIEVHPHLGYRLLEVPDRLIADDIRARLGVVEANFIRDRGKDGANRSRLEAAPATTTHIKNRIIGSEILVFEQTSSTNNVVARMAKTQRGEGLVVFAESQTKGRGRHGRPWSSPHGKGLWFSALLRPNLPLSATPRITVAASVAVARAIRTTTGLDARIKWPNDVTVNGRKVAGILVETSARLDEGIKKTGGTGVPASVPTDPEQGGVEQCIILGVGIDVNCRHEDFPGDVAEIASSLEIESGSRQDRAELAAEVLGELEAYYAAARKEFDAIIAEWAQLCTTLGKQLVVTMGRRRIEGCAQALDEDGALLLRKDNGQIERILGGDVTVEK